MPAKPKNKLPKLLTDTEALELLYGPTEGILTAADMEEYQDWMAEAIKGLPGVLLGAEMGLGKTGATLKAIVDMLAERIVTKVLVVAPLRVAEETWPEEIRKWDFSRHLTYRVVTGDLEERKAALRFGPADVTMVNRENLLWLLKYIGTKRWPWDMIVYDESSRLQRGDMRSTPKARADGTAANPRLTDLGVIQLMRLKTKRFVGLTGTPAPGGLRSLFGQMMAVDGGERLGTSKTRFENDFFITEKYTNALIPKAGSEQVIMRKISDRFFSLREEDYIKLPPLVEVDHWVNLPTEMQKRYKKFERDTAMDVVNRWGDPEVIEAVNQGVLTGKLLQFANGSIYTSEKEAIPLHSYKLDILESIFEEASGRPILVAYGFQFDRDAIKKRFGKKCRIFGETRDDKRDWDAGRIPMLLMHPASAGHGLNFQGASNIAVWYGLTWSHELYWQFNKRLHRRGQKEDRVFLHRIVTRKTVDTDIMPVLMDKKATEDRIKATVKARLEWAATDERYSLAA